MLLGGALSQFLESFLPDSVGDVDLDADLDPDIDTGFGGASGHAESMEVGSANALSKLLGWLQVGRVPLLALLVAFLTVFGLSGLLVQAFARGLVGFPLPSLLAVVPAFLIALPGTRVAGRVMARMIPKDETSAVSRKTFIGRVATITLGTAARGQPAEARLTDEYGQNHYVRVEPDDKSETFAKGEQVLLVSRRASVFRAIRATSEALVDS